MRNYLFLTLVVIGFSVAGCQSAKVQEPRKEILTDAKEQDLDLELESKLKSEFGLYQNAALEKNLTLKLEQIANVNNKETKHEYPIPKIKMLNTGNKLIASGFINRIYISKGLISIARYDNEAAFLLAFVLLEFNEGLTSKKYLDINGQSLGNNIITLPTQAVALNAIADPVAKNWFQKGGLFDYGKDQTLDYLKKSISLASKAGFDPRGSITLAKRWVDGSDYPVFFPEKEDFLKLTRDEVAKMAPLKDPIVRTVAYEKILKSLDIKKSKSK